MTKYLTGTRDGERKRRKEKRKNTNTNTPSPQRANPERARKKKRTDDGPNTNQRGGRKRLTQLTKREPSIVQHAKDPDLT